MSSSKSVFLGLVYVAVYRLALLPYTCMPYLIDTRCNLHTPGFAAKYAKGRPSILYNHTCPFVANRFKKCAPNRNHKISSPYSTCTLPVFNSDSLALIRGRTLAFWGDSLNWQFAGSTMCMLTSGNYESVKRISFGDKPMTDRSFCILWNDGTRVCVYNKGKVCDIEKGVIDWGPILDNLTHTDIVVANFGVHYNRFSSGVDKLTTAINMLATQLSNNVLTASFIWRETSLQHFRSPDGSFQLGIPPGCKRIRRNKLREAMWRNDICSPVMERVTPHILRVALSTANTPVDMHRGGRDCTHYCNPGVTDDWVPWLFTEISHINSQR